MDIVYHSICICVFSLFDCIKLLGTMDDYGNFLEVNKYYYTIFHLLQLLFDIIIINFFSDGY